jgi:hypothetical protein
MLVSISPVPGLTRPPDLLFVVEFQQETHSKKEKPFTSGTITRIALLICFELDVFKEFSSAKHNRRRPFIHPALPTDSLAKEQADNDCSGEPSNLRSTNEVMALTCFVSEYSFSFCYRIHLLFQQAAPVPR